MIEITKINAFKQITKNSLEQKKGKIKFLDEVIAKEIDSIEHDIKNPT